MAAILIPPQATRQTTARRTGRTPAAGELVFDTDTGRLYVGDGTTIGGVLAAPADSDAVHRTGAETVAGLKTFATAPVLGNLSGLLRATSGTLTGLSNVSGSAAGNLVLTPEPMPGSPVDGEIWYGSAQLALGASIGGAVQRLVGCIFSQTADVTFSNTLSVLSLVGSGVGTVTIKANTPVAGKTVRLRARGAFNSSATPPTLNFQVFLGPTRVCVTSAITLPASQTARYWDAEFDLTFRSGGASGSVYASGRAMISSNFGIASSPAPTTLDTTGDLPIDLRASFSLADPANSITCSTLTLEVLN